jgi:hypothetical protein
VIRPTKRPTPDSSQHSKETDIHAPGGIQKSSSTKRVTTDLRLRQRGTGIDEMVNRVRDFVNRVRDFVHYFLSFKNLLPGNEMVLTNSDN